jgi:hypothetical protein
MWFLGVVKIETAPQKAQVHVGVSRNTLMLMRVAILLQLRVFV